MKKIEAIVKPFKLEEIKEALEELGVHGMTVTEVSGYGQQKGRALTLRGKEYDVDYVPKLKLEIVVSRKIASEAVKTVTRVANVASPGGGKVFSSNVDQAIRIRTGEHGERAL